MARGPSPHKSRGPSGFRTIGAAGVLRVRWSRQGGEPHDSPRRAGHGAVSCRSTMLSAAAAMASLLGRGFQCRMRRALSVEKRRA